LEVLAQKKTASSYGAPAIRNLEVIKWTDWKNRERTIEIHREVEPYA
jgi:hypothetical protein